MNASIEFLIIASPCGWQRRSVTAEERRPRSVAAANNHLLLAVTSQILPGGNFVKDVLPFAGGEFVLPPQAVRAARISSRCGRRQFCSKRFDKACR
jgi:hypothetical protein